MILKKHGDFISIKNTEPFIGIDNILNYEIIIQPDSSDNVLKEFRWSIDNKTFSSWIELSNTNLRSIDFKYLTNTWFEIRITNTGKSEIVVDENSFKLNYNIKNNIKYKNIKPPYILEIETGNWKGLSKVPDTYFKPYNINPAISLQEELSYYVNTIFGHEVDYFRSVADDKGKDIIIKEYTIYNVLDPICIKVMVEGNEFPDNQMQYNPFGVSFETPFEVDIDKNYWKEYFPDNTGPQKRDVLYFKLTNRFYEVTSSYMVRGFMQEETHWKVSLIKYSPKSNRKEPKSLKDAVNSLTTSMEKEFGVERKDEEEKLTKPQQYTSDTTNRKKDPIRERLNSEINIVSTPLKNYGLVIAEQYYDLRNLIYKNEDVIAVKYLPNLNISTDISYSAWFSERAPLQFNPIDKVETLAISSNQALLRLKTNREFQEGDFIKISKGSKLVVWGTVVSQKSPNSIYININKEVKDELDNINPLWSGLNGWICEKIKPVNFISAGDSINNFSIDLYASKYIVITLNNKKYIRAIGSDLGKNKWYGIFINISKIFRQIEINIWERKWIEDVYSSPQTTDLFNIHHILINNITIPDIISDKKYELKASNSFITNIRLFNKIAEIEKQPVILNQNIVKDSQNSIIIDNALPRYYLPNIIN